MPPASRSDRRLPPGPAAFRAQGGLTGLCGGACRAGLGRDFVERIVGIEEIDRAADLTVEAARR